MIDEIVSLPESVVLGIKQFIKDKGLKSQTLLRDGIFALLEQYCTVLYYPQKEEENDGCHVKRLVIMKLLTLFSSIHINPLKNSFLLQLMN